MTSEVLRADVGSELRVVRHLNADDYYEVKCKGFKLQRFQTFKEAEVFFDRWAPEIAKEIELFDD